jgi:hypothetical protein
MDWRNALSYRRIVPGRNSCCLLLPQSSSRKSPGAQTPGLLFLPIHQGKYLSVGRLVNLAQQPPILPPRTQQQTDCEHRRSKDQRIHGTPSGLLRSTHNRDMAQHLRAQEHSRDSLSDINGPLPDWWCTRGVLATHTLGPWSLPVWMEARPLSPERVEGRMSPAMPCFDGLSTSVSSRVGTPPKRSAPETSTAGRFQRRRAARCYGHRTCQTAAFLKLSAALSQFTTLNQASM